jgi:DNA recombination protein RmuC
VLCATIPDMEPTTMLTVLLVLFVGLALGAAIGGLTVRSRLDGSAAQERRQALEHRVADHAVVKEGLERLHDQMRDLEQQRVSWQAMLRQQVEDVRHSTDSLRRETASLATALRKPQVRGRWGELHLRRAVELAGMVDRCDFAEQVSVARDDASGSADRGRLRPDLVVQLAGGKHVVVDAKVPLDAFLDATSANDDEEREAHLRRHARQLRTHVDALGGKAYWRALPATPEFVVLFVPGESFLSAALEAEPELLEYAASRQVVLATPTTLIALLRTVAYAWTQETLADKAREIHTLGRELHDRVSVMAGHLDRLGRSLTASVSSYNRTVGSLETRVLVSTRRFQELQVTDQELTAPEPVTDAVRPLTAAELLDAVAERPEPLSDGDPHRPTLGGPAGEPAAPTAARRVVGE